MPVPSRESRESRSPTPGDLLRVTRALKRETQSDVGRDVGLAASSICLIESGERRITADVARRLGEHFFGDVAESS